MTSPLDARAQAVVDRLQAEARRQTGSLVRHYLPKLPRLLLGRPLDWSGTGEFYDDKLLPVEPGQGALLYLLARSSRARLAVEFGTSFGVSTIYLAAAMRDAGQGGRVIGTELVAGKIAAARANLKAAGLAKHVELREGDARETLRDLDQPVNLLLLDGWPPLAIDILRLVEPKLALGALVVVDNVGQFAADLRPLTERLTSNPIYRTARLPFKGGTLVAVHEPAREQADGGDDGN